MNNFTSSERSPEIRSNERSINTKFLKMSAQDPIQQAIFQPFKIKAPKYEMRGSLRLNSVSLKNEKFPGSPPVRDHRKLNNQSFKSDYQRFQKSPQHSEANIKNYEQILEGETKVSRNRFANKNNTSGDCQKYIDFRNPKSSTVVSNVFSIDSLTPKKKQKLSRDKESIKGRRNSGFGDPKLNNYKRIKNDSKSKKRSMINNQSNIAINAPNIPRTAEIHNKTVTEPSVSIASMRRTTLGTINNNWVLEKPGFITMKAQYKNDYNKSKKGLKGTIKANSTLKFGLNKTTRISEITNSMLSSSVSTKLHLNSKMTSFDCGKSGNYKPKSNLMSNLENLGLQHSIQSQRQDFTHLKII
jgi:hypothetical protein